WLIMQAGDTLAPALHLPEWVNSALAFFLILGFPLALFFAWAFEMTPEGIKKEKDVDRSQSITTVTGAKLNRTITIVLVLALGYFAVDKFVLAPKRDAALVQAARNEVVEKVVNAEPGAAENPAEPAGPAAKSIAVLPFINMSDDGANEYFSDGLTEELLNLLAKIPDLKVAARTSSFQFKGKTGDIETIAEQLKVANVLEGSVRKSGNQVRITAQLIKADDGYHLWSETYDRTLENIFVVQDEIAAAVVDSLKLTLLGEAAPKATETNPEAYAQFLQGRYWFNQTSEANSVKSVEAYQRAIDIDPNYAPAWAGFSLATLYQAGQNWIPLESGLEKARDAAEHAVRLDPDLALGWVSLVRIQGDYDWNWNASNKSMQKALALEPNASYVLAAAGRLSASLGQLDQAVAHYRQAVTLDPLNQRAYDAFAGALDLAGLLQEAEAVERHLYSLNPDYAAIHASLAWIFLRQGKAEQALDEVARESIDFWGSLIRNLVLYSLGRHQEADEELARFEEKFHTFGAYQIAQIYGWRNDADNAFKWLDQAFDQHDPGLGSLLGDTTLRSLHADPRWLALVGKIGLQDAWNKMPDQYKGPLQ
ncbi:MAG: hypothetical protein WBS20_16185, partial [Lysobacterales bacterium]